MNRIDFMRAFALAIPFALAALVLSSCDDNSTEHVSQYHLTPYSGNNQTERAGSTLPEPLVVKVTDLLNNPLPGIRVTFSPYDDPLGSVTPVNVATDQDGLASCTYQLGPRIGLQRVMASASAEFFTLFSATSVAAACDEESTEKLCVWPLKHIFIATTSSSLLSGTGSVVIDFDPASGEAAEVLETTNRVDGISFSSRGELFVSMEDVILKADPTIHDLHTYTNCNWPSARFSLEPNPGGVLAGLNYAAPHLLGCSGAVVSLSSGHAFASVLWENLAVDPVTRDIRMLTASGPTNYVLWRGLWDGRATSIESWESAANLFVGTAEPRGMCADSAGTIYICFDGNDNWRRIVTVAADGTIDYEFFDFYSYYGGNAQNAGRWGDIAYLDGKLYVIDRRNDRLVVISKTGEWLAEYKSDVFSMPLVETDHYAICASPNWLCGTR
jgi:hypothetical protein